MILRLPLDRVFAVFEAEREKRFQRKFLNSVFREIWTMLFLEAKKWLCIKA